jgi:hypothetical protein
MNISTSRRKLSKIRQFCSSVTPAQGKWRRSRCKASPHAGEIVLISCTIESRSEICCPTARDPKSLATTIHRGQFKFRAGKGSGASLAQGFLSLSSALFTVMVFGFRVSGQEGSSHSPLHRLPQFPNPPRTGHTFSSCPRHSARCRRAKSPGTALIDGWRARHGMFGQWVGNCEEEEGGERREEGERVGRGRESKRETKGEEWGCLMEIHCTQHSTALCHPHARQWEIVQQKGFGRE